MENKMARERERERERERTKEERQTEWSEREKEERKMLQQFVIMLCHMTDGTGERMLHITVDGDREDSLMERLLIAVPRQETAQYE